MTYRFLGFLAFIPVSLVLASCSSSTTLACGNSHPYGGYNARPPLTAPSGVTLPTPDPAYVVPAAGSHATAVPAASTTLAQPCLVAPPSVLTPADMAPAKKPVPAAGTAPKPQPAPVPASAAPPVAGGGHME